MAKESLRNIPSPEQGASKITKSKRPLFSWKLEELSCVIIAFDAPHFNTFSRRTAFRFPSISFEIKTPFSVRKSEAMSVFPPGAAHISRPKSPSSVLKLSCFNTCSKSCWTNPEHSSNLHEREGPEQKTGELPIALLFPTKE